LCDGVAQATNAGRGQAQLPDDLLRALRPALHLAARPLRRRSGATARRRATGRGACAAACRDDRRSAQVRSHRSVRSRPRNPVWDCACGECGDGAPGAAELGGVRPPVAKDAAPEFLGRRRDRSGHDQHRHGRPRRLRMRASAESGPFRRGHPAVGSHLCRRISAGRASRRVSQPGLRPIHARANRGLLASRGGHISLVRSRPSQQQGRGVARTSQRRAGRDAVLPSATAHGRPLDVHRRACGLQLGRELCLRRREQRREVPRPPLEHLPQRAGLALRRRRRTGGWRPL
jgi:hypothetical protein